MFVKPSRDGSRPLPLAQPGVRVQIMVRPEKMKVLKSAPGAEQNAIEGVLQDVLYQGPVTQFIVQPGSGPIVTVTQTNTAVTARRTFNTGDKLFVAWAPEDCLLMGVDGVLPMGQAPVPEAAQPPALPSGSCSPTRWKRRRHCRRFSWPHRLVRPAAAKA